MKSFKEFLAELSTQKLSAYIRAGDDKNHPIRYSGQSKDWHDFQQTEKGIVLAKLKIRNKAVKVPAGRATSGKIRAKDAFKKKLHPIEIHGESEECQQDSKSTKNT